MLLRQLLVLLLLLARMLLLLLLFLLPTVYAGYRKYSTCSRFLLQFQLSRFALQLASNEVER